MDRSVAERIVELESRRYLSDIGLLKKLSLKHSMPIARYILCSCVCLPVKTVIVGERPYATDIHPLVSSAMSYDPSKSRATPSTVGMARDMSNNLGTTYLEVERWFRDGWKYLASGVLIVNCNTFVNFSSSRSQSETVPFQKWLRVILDCSMLLSEDKIDVICMGVPSQNVVDPLLRSIGTTRRGINKAFCANPASIASERVGDTRSLSSTLGNKTASRSVLSAIQRSKTTLELSTQDYLSILSREMSAQLPQVNKLVQAANDIATQIDDAYKELEGNHKLPDVKDAVSTFTAALIEYRDAVLKDIVMTSMAMAGDNSNKVGKATEWGNKKPWQKGPKSTGTSSRMSVVTEDSHGVDQKFEDEADEPVTFADDTETELAKKVEAPKKKKKVMKKVVKVKKSPPDATVVGSKLDNSAASVLKSVSYFVSDKYNGVSKTLEASIANSINGNVAVDDDICLIIDTAAMDFRTTGSTASGSLGLDDGEVSETCSLPKLIEKLAETRL